MRLWRLTQENKLENFAGPWKNGSKNLSIPSQYQFSREYIKDIDTGNVIGFKMLDGKELDELVFDAKFVPNLQGKLMFY